MRLLVVEDDPQLGAQIVQALTEAGHVVERAEDGRDALHLGEQENFDAVVLDLGLPGMDGLSVLTRWRQNGRAIVITSYSIHYTKLYDLRLTSETAANPLNSLVRPVVSRMNSLMDRWGTNS